MAPGVVAGLIPWLITGWQVPDWGPGSGWSRRWRALLILAGVVFLLAAFIRFALAGGTPAPPAPTQHLVVDGPYRYVRNPMYLAVAAIILGQALLFGSWWALLYLGIALTAVVLFVKLYEEPTLEETYGEEYREYRRNVRGGGRGCVPGAVIHSEPGDFRRTGPTFA